MDFTRFKFFRLSKASQFDLVNKFESASRMRKKSMLKHMTTSELTKLMEGTLARQKYDMDADNRFYEILQLGVDKEKSLDALMELVAYQRPTKSFKFANSQQRLRDSLSDKTILDKISTALKVDISKNNRFAKSLRDSQNLLIKINPRLRLTSIMNKKAVKNKTADLNNMINRASRIKKNEFNDFKLTEENIIEPSKVSKLPKNSIQTAYLFDRCAHSLIQLGSLYKKNNNLEYDNDSLTELGRAVRSDLIQEYTKALGSNDRDMIEVFVKMEMENYAGKPYVPTMENYPKFFKYVSEKEFSTKYKGRYTSLAENICNSNRHDYSKHLLGIEKVENFEINGVNLGEVYITKSELPPTSYIAAQGEYHTPLIEYFVKGDNGSLTRIGSSIVDRRNGKIEKCIINTDKKDMSDELIYNLEHTLDNPKNIEFQPQDYSGKKTAFTRQDIENNMAENAIKKYLGENINLKNVSQVNDLSFNSDGMHPMLSYLIEFENEGKTSYDLVYMDFYGQCKQYPKLEIVNKEKILNIPTGKMDYNKINKVLPDIESKKSTQSFKINDNEYSVYLDDNNKLCLCENVEYKDQLSMYKNITLSYPLNINFILETNSNNAIKSSKNILDNVTNHNVVQQKIIELNKQK